jgi:hypothetical protein
MAYHTPHYLHSIGSYYGTNVQHRKCLGARQLIVRQPNFFYLTSIEKTMCPKQPLCLVHQYFWQELMHRMLGWNHIRIPQNWCHRNWSQLSHMYPILFDLHNCLTQNFILMAMDYAFKCQSIFNKCGHPNSTRW